MARTPSTMLALGTPAPDFSLPDCDGRVHALADFAGAPALRVTFICNHGPFVKHIRDELAARGIVLKDGKDANGNPVTTWEIAR